MWIEEPEAVHSRYLSVNRWSKRKGWNRKLLTINTVEKIIEALKNNSCVFSLNSLDVTNLELFNGNHSTWSNVYCLRGDTLGLYPDNPNSLYVDNPNRAMRRLHWFPLSHSFSPWWLQFDSEGHLIVPWSLPIKSIEELTSLLSDNPETEGTECNSPGRKLLPLFGKLLKQSRRLESLHCTEWKSSRL